MSEQSYRIVGSTPFKFLVGPDRKPFTVHAALVAHHSKPLGALINGGMQESKEGCAVLEDVDEHTFVRFSQYAYTGNYTEAWPANLLGSSGIGTGNVTQIPRPTVSLFAEASTVATFPTPTVQSSFLRAASAQSVSSFGASVTPAVNSSSLFGTSVTTSGTSSGTSANPSGYSASSFETSFKSPVDKKEETTRPKKTGLWSAFEKITYPVVIFTFLPIQNTKACMDYTEVFLSHARLYVFADKYDIEPLRNLCLHKLHRTLVKFTLYEERAGDIIELMRYAYSNTPDRSGSKDGLRSLVAHYAACAVEDLARSDKYELLFEEHGSLARDLVHYMLKRLD
ncbi:MAG: hypothetical protein M1816_006934 [Peltula sp. TS41687]|nr:MAG: hypothetical protein M1816_006934 [Peltula sp. TS41687]